MRTRGRLPPFFLYGGDIFFRRSLDYSKLPFMKNFLKWTLALACSAFATYMPGESGYASLYNDHGLFNNPAALPYFGSAGALGTFEIENGVRGMQLGGNIGNYGVSFEYRTDDEGFDEARWGITQGTAIFDGLFYFGHRVNAFRSADFDGTEFSYTPGVIVAPFHFMSLGYTGHDLVFFGPQSPKRIHEFGATLRFGDLAVSYDLYDFDRHSLLAELEFFGYQFGLEIPLKGGGEYRLNLARSLGTSFELGTRFSEDYIPHHVGLAYHYARDPKASSMVVARVPLNVPVKETEGLNVPFFGERSLSVYTVKHHIDQILASPNLGIVIFDFSGYSGGWAVSKEIARGIARIKESGRYVVAFLDDVRPTTLIAASAANLKVAEPSARVTFRGFGGSSLFYKGLLSKLGVQVEFLRHGDYKSAVERYMADSMSTEARSDLERVYKGRWDMLLKFFPEESRAALDSFATKPMLTASAAYRAGLVDTVLYIEDVPRVAVKKFAHVDAPYAWAQVYTPSDRPILGMNRGYRPQLALITVDGTITAQSAEKTIAEIHKVEDSGAGALILRINSPGGSAQASDKVWSALRDLSKRGMPIVASIGDMGASGGYYIACGADEIIAEDFSLVGSIGIYGGKINVSGLLDKVGLKPQTVQTHPHADAETFTRGFDEEERAALQDFMDDFYDRFLGVVARATKLTKERIDKDYGGGRVFTGSEALASGLVKKLGGLDVAIAEAKFLAGYSLSTQVEIYDASADDFYMLSAPRIPLVKMDDMVSLKRASLMLQELGQTNLWAVDLDLMNME